MVQLADLFSVPEMSLLCNVLDYFQRHQIDFHPEILFSDVKVGHSKWYQQTHVHAKLFFYLFPLNFFSYSHRHLYKTVIQSCTD